MRLINRIAEGQLKKVFLSEGAVEVTLASDEVYVYGRREGFGEGGQNPTPGDELDEFSKLCRSKWNKGRREYKAKGVGVYQADTVQELQNELLDVANYCAILFWEFERIKRKFRYKPERRE